MKNLIRKFNEFSGHGAKMLPINYIKPKSGTPHSSPHHGYRQTFKLIDLNGSDDQKRLAIDVISSLTSHDAIQILHEQPSTQELHFWVNQFKYTQILNNIWSIAIEDAVVRLGPAHYTQKQHR